MQEEFFRRLPSLTRLILYLTTRVIGTITRQIISTRYSRSFLIGILFIYLSSIIIIIYMYLRTGRNASDACSARVLHGPLLTPTRSQDLCVRGKEIRFLS